MILSSAFMNNGNYGTPVVLLVFGTAGLDTAVVLMVPQTVNHEYDRHVLCKEKEVRRKADLKRS